MGLGKPLKRISTMPRNASQLQYTKKKDDNAGKFDRKEIFFSHHKHTHKLQCNLFATIVINLSTRI